MRAELVVRSCERCRANIRSRAFGLERSFGRERVGAVCACALRLASLTGTWERLSDSCVRAGARAVRVVRVLGEEASVRA